MKKSLFLMFLLALPLLAGQAFAGEGCCKAKGSGCAITTCCQDGVCACSCGCCKDGKCVCASSECCKDGFCCKK